MKTDLENAADELAALTAREAHLRERNLPLQASLIEKIAAGRAKVRKLEEARDGVAKRPPIRY